jgi:hypothetical protein
MVEVLQLVFSDVQLAGIPQLSVFLALATAGSALSATACKVFVISLNVCTE